MKSYFSHKIPVMALVITCSFTALSLFAQEKKKRVFSTKETTVRIIDEKFEQERIDSFIVKFAEGTRVRLRVNRFVIPDNAIKTREIKLLEENSISRDSLQKELQRLNALLNNTPGVLVKRQFERPEQEIENEQDTLEKKVNEELADLNLYYLVILRQGDARRLIKAINSFKIVENAYPLYKAENAFFKSAAVTSQNEPGNPAEFSDRQLYLNPAPKGIDARYAWTINGGKGEGIKIIDIEQRWDLNHEDLKAAFWVSSFNVKSNGDNSGDHGTAVLGEIAGKHNDIGVKGICPEAAYGVSGVSTQFSHNMAVSAAIDKASVQLKAGDIILIEQHTPGPVTGEPDNGCNSSQFEFVPMEFYQDCFDAIRRATAKGIIVVEAAGNGGVNLDAPLYKNLFNKKIRDSKAIMVAGDEGGNGVATCWTNYGNRIDFYGWGLKIITTGYGEFPAMPTDLHKKYTAQFGGTSGASPIIVGAIACIQGIRKNRGLKVWTGDQVRENMAGTPQAAGNKFIGKMPDLKATIEKMN